MLSAGSSLLAVVAFAVGVVAVSTPYWATFEDFIGKCTAVHLDPLWTSEKATATDSDSRWCGAWMRLRRLSIEFFKTHSELFLRLVVNPTPLILTVLYGADKRPTTATTATGVLPF